MSISILIAVELALVLVALGFLLEAQSNSTVSNVVAGLIIILGVFFLGYALFRNTSIPSKEAPVFGSVDKSRTQQVDSLLRIDNSPKV